MKFNTVIKVSMLLALVYGFANSPSYAGWFAQKHPRRAEVLHRDNNINRRLNKDYGKLGGNYGRLEHQDQSIRFQEQRDARQNGGYITKGERHQLNREENHVNREVNRDYTGGQGAAPVVPQ